MTVWKITVVEMVQDARMGPVPWLTRPFFEEDHTWVDPDDCPEQMIQVFAQSVFPERKITVTRQTPTPVMGRLGSGETFRRNIIQL